MFLKKKKTTVSYFKYGRLHKASIKISGYEKLTRE